MKKYITVILTIITCSLQASTYHFNGTYPSGEGGACFVYVDESKPDTAFISCKHTFSAEHGCTSEKAKTREITNREIGKYFYKDVNGQTCWVSSRYKPEYSAHKPMIKTDKNVS